MKRQLNPGRKRTPPKMKKHLRKKEPADSVRSKIDELMSGMTLEEKVGQMFIARCPDIDAAAAVKPCVHIGKGSRNPEDSAWL